MREGSHASTSPNLPLLPPRFRQSKVSPQAHCRSWFVKNMENFISSIVTSAVHTTGHHGLIHLTAQLLRVLK